MKKNLFLAILFLTSFIAFSQDNKTKTQKVIQNQGITDPGCSGYVYVDNDFDGYGSGSRLCADLIIDETLNYVALGGDCDDTNPSITVSKYWYLDADADSFGGTSTATKLCTPPNASYIAISGDCNDTNAAINPNTIWYRDADNDTFGNPVVTLIQCAQPVGYVLNNTDCNDSNNTILSSIIWYYDGDIDGFGNPNVTLVQCTQPVGYVSNNTDCNDSNSTQNINYTWYSDSDGDGFGDPSSSLLACVQPANYVSNNQDECPTVSGTLLGCVVSPATTLFGNTQNYVLTITPKQPVASVQNITNENDVNKAIVYYDGLGRPMQKIANAQSNSGKDIVTHIEYDAFGRQTKEYLPFPSTQNTLAYIDGATAQSNTISFYQTAYGDMNPYSEKLFEASPLDKVFKQAAPGNSWSMGSGHEIKFDYETNTASEVKLIQATAAWNATLGLHDITISNPGNYAANELYKTVTKNENWTSGTNGTTQEFKNKEGKVVLKRTFNTATAHDTYYVYDQYGNLTYVIPPLAEGAIDLNTLNGLCYQYKYDNRNRLVEKKLPGKQWEFIVYDKLDRPVATGPALSPFTSPIGDGWMVTKYDAFSRAILTGWQPATINSAQRKTLQDAYNATTTLNETKSTTSTTINLVVFNYTNLALPTSGYHVLTVNYYDDYVFPNAGAIPTAVEGQTVYYNNTQKPKGLATGSWVRVLETTSLIRAETNLTFYDYKARPIRVRSNNHLLGYTEIDNKLDFSGKTLYTITRHKKDNGGGSVEIVTKEEYNYSGQDRLLTNTHQITSTSNLKQLLLSNTYDELGQLVTKKVGGLDVTGAVGLQKVDYKYNIRGWLKEINNVDNLIESSSVPKDLFAFKINYNENPITGLNAQETAVPQLYNGNISETVWRTASDDKKRKYGYVYDDLNRLNNAIFQDPTASIVTNSFNENLTYDKNGNILSLNRNDYIPSLPYNTMIDNLVYNYDTTNKNQLVKVADSSGNTNGFKDGVNSGNDFTYDANGNMLTDLNKGITTSIVYNHLNLPTRIVFSTGSIDYLYNAVGQKLEKKVIQTSPILNTTTLYLNGGYQYINNNLEYFPTAEGYVKYAGGVFSSYVFNYTDHLGNIRVSYKENGGSLQILEENNYYPFGLKHKNYNTNNYQPTYKYRYNQKEWQDELGLNWYDYGWRNYDPAISRWVNPDPLLNDLRFTFDDSDVDEDDDDEVYESLITKLDTGGGIYNTNNLNPYGYGYNNPVSFEDPDGRCPICPIIAIAIMLLSSEPAMAPTHDRKDGQRMADAKADKVEFMTNAIPGVGLRNATGGAVLRATVKNEAKNKVKEQIKKTVEKTHQTYTKTNPKTGETYSGRTSGKGTPKENVAKRDGNHHKNKEGFGKAKLDKSTTNSDAARGREQQLIKNNGGAKSEGGTSGNSINGVGPKNPKATQYNNAAKKEFGD